MGASALHASKTAGEWSILCTAAQLAGCRSLSLIQQAGRPVNCHGPAATVPLKTSPLARAPLPEERQLQASPRLQHRVDLLGCDRPHKRQLAGPDLIGPKAVRACTHRIGSPAVPQHLQAGCSGRESAPANPSFRLTRKRPGLNRRTRRHSGRPRGSQGPPQPMHAQRRRQSCVAGSRPGTLFLGTPGSWFPASQSEGRCRSLHAGPAQSATAGYGAGQRGRGKGLLAARKGGRPACLQGAVRVSTRFLFAPECLHHRLVANRLAALPGVHCLRWQGGTGARSWRRGAMPVRHARRRMTGGRKVGNTSRTARSCPFDRQREPATVSLQGAPHAAKLKPTHLQHQLNSAHLCAAVVPQLGPKPAPAKRGLPVQPTSARRSGATWPASCAGGRAKVRTCRRPACLCRSAQ